jgi:hypothetical protein
VTDHTDSLNRDRDRTDSSHSRKASSSSGRRMANEIGLGANSNE